jgi:putative Holliday junction resolvase
MTPGHRLLGLDVGTVRIGVAVSDELGIIATPIGFVARGPNDRAAFRKLVDHYQIGEIVAGMPRGMSGREGPQAQDVRTYSDALAEDLELSLTYWDERLTTVIAERSLISGGRSRQQRRSEIDSASAAVMLQGYLDRQASRRRQEPS